MNINDRDVVSMDASKSLIGLETFKLSQLPAGLKERWGTNAIEEWLTQGIDCEVLAAETGGGWRKGKIRLRLEFVPDVSNPVPPPPPRAISDRTPARN